MQPSLRGDQQKVGAGGGIHLFQEKEIYGKEVGWSLRVSKPAILSDHPLYDRPQG